jgi:IS1 family transposase
VDEIWSFVFCKQANAPKTKSRMEGRGDIWTWTAIDADTKLLVSWFVGGRHGDSAYEFMSDLYDRLANRVQLTSDGHRAYLEAVAGTFGDRVDYAQLVKIYGPAPEGQRRYSPPVILAAVKERVFGDPDPAHVSTSYAEAHNMTMRTCMRRFTRLTNGFSKKVENHAYSVALHAMYYNFVRIHKTLRVSPAMAAGVTNKIWEIGDMVAVLEAREADQQKTAA